MAASANSRLAQENAVAAVTTGNNMINSHPQALSISWPALLPRFPSIGDPLICPLGARLALAGKLRFTKASADSGESVSSSGYNFALQAERTFGKYGYALTSGFLATIVVGWYAFQTGLTGTTIHACYGWNETATIIFATILYTGVTFIGIKALSIVGMIAAPLYIVLGLVAVGFIAASHPLADILNYRGVGMNGIMSLGSAVTLVVATFADSGTMTADFTRWSKDGKSAVLATLTAFPIANMIAQLFGIVIVSAGAAATPATSGGDFLPVLASHSGISRSSR
jgi:cytosine permease